MRRMHPGWGPRRIVFELAKKNSSSSPFEIRVLTPGPPIGRTPANPGTRPLSVMTVVPTVEGRAAARPSPLQPTIVARRRSRRATLWGRGRGPRARGSGHAACFGRQRRGGEAVSSRGGHLSLQGAPKLQGTVGAGDPTSRYLLRTVSGITSRWPANRRAQRKCAQDDSLPSLRSGPGSVSTCSRSFGILAKEAQSDVVPNSLA